MRNSALILRLGGAILAVAVLAAALVLLLQEPKQRHMTAYFTKTVGLYKGAEVRILGIPVGEVTSVKPVGDAVKVELKWDAKYKVPANAQAVIVNQTLVADRYVQLTPAYTGGPQLKDHDEIPATRTATPVEVDQLYDSITRLSTALGPDGANATGALSRLLDTGAQNLDGNGKAIGDSIAQLGAASRTLDGHSGDLFATLSYLQSFTAMLKANDGKVRAATDQLSTVTGFLADDKEDLGGALRQLSTALGQVKTFIQDNRTRLRTSIAKLAPITQTLVDQRASLAELLDTAPLAADNVLAAYDPRHGTLDGRADINELSMGPNLATASTATTTAAGTTAGTSGTAPASAALRPVAPGTSTLPLPLPPVGTVYGSTPAKGAAR